jgi:hypothetical protein
MFLYTRWLVSWVSSKWGFRSETFSQVGFAPPEPGRRLFGRIKALEQADLPLSSSGEGSFLVALNTTRAVYVQARAGGIAGRLTICDNQQIGIARRPWEQPDLFGMMGWKHSSRRPRCSDDSPGYHEQRHQPTRRMGE